ncbi:hypothetical protein NFI96_025918, partial [Prochilodus magdalenae]
MTSEQSSSSVLHSIPLTADDEGGAPVSLLLLRAPLHPDCGLQCCGGDSPQCSSSHSEEQETLQR